MDGENPEINKIASWHSSLAKLNGKSYELAVHVIQAALHDEYFVKNKLPGKDFSRQIYSYDQLIQQKNIASESSTQTTAAPRDFI